MFYTIWWHSLSNQTSLWFSQISNLLRYLFWATTKLFLDLCNSCSKFNNSKSSSGWALSWLIMASVRSSYSCLGRLPTSSLILPLFLCQLFASLPHLSPPSHSDTHTNTAKWALLRGGSACKATLARVCLCQTNQHTWFTYHRARGLISYIQDKTEGT